MNQLQQIWVNFMETVWASVLRFTDADLFIYFSFLSRVMEEFGDLQQNWVKH